MSLILATRSGVGKDAEIVPEAEADGFEDTLKG